MKITILVRSLDFGGAERQLVALAKGLHARSHRVVVAIYYPGGPFESELHGAGVRVHSLGKRGRWDLFRFLFRLGRFLREERPEVLLGYMETSNVLSVLTKPVHQGKAVFGVRASNMNLDNYDWMSRLTPLVERILGRYADLLIFNSHAGRSFYDGRIVPQDRQVVIPNGIDTERFHPDAAARRRARAALKVADHERLIGIVARIDPMKDHTTFLRAAAHLGQRRNDLRFVCVGTGPIEYFDHLRRLADDLELSPRLIWTGARGDMPAIYNALDVAVSASSYGEGFPNVVGEAMACGVPCVVTDVGDSAWIVGDTGMIVPPRDPLALGDAIEAMLACSTTSAAAANMGRERIVANFSLPRLLDETENALIGMLSPGVS